MRDLVQTLDLAAIMIRDAFAYWDDGAIHFKGHEIRCAGNGFAGISRMRLPERFCGAFGGSSGSPFAASSTAAMIV